MNISRREILAGLGSMATLNTSVGVRSGFALLSESKGFSESAREPSPLPARRDSGFPEVWRYLNSAYTHRILTGGWEALRDSADRRARREAVSKPLQKKPVDIKAEFAALINAKRFEISFIPNTST